MIMMKRYKKILLTGVLSALSCSFVHAQELYKNENAPVHERVMDLISRLTVEEKISLLRATSPGIPRLGIDKYYHGNEALHGVVRPGRFTVFPQAIGLAATWNPELQKRVATVISDRAGSGKRTERTIQRCADFLVAYREHGTRPALGTNPGNVWRRPFPEWNNGNSLCERTTRR